MPAKSRTAPNPEDDPYALIGGGSVGGALSFSACPPSDLSGAIDAVTRRGDALVFSRTSDGGAVSVRVLHDSLVTKWYAANLDELQALLGGLAAL